MSIKRDAKNHDRLGSRRSKKQKTTVAEDNEEIPSDDEGLRTPSASGDEAEPEEPTSALSAEEKRLLLAQECLKRMGMSCAGVELDEVVKTLIPNEAQRQRVKTVEVVEKFTYAPPVFLTSVGHRATCLALDPVKNEIAYTGGKDSRIMQWDMVKDFRVANKGKRADPESGGHYGDVNAVAIGWNGRLLVSGGYDQILRIWDTRQMGRKCIAELSGHQGPITAIGIQSDNVYTTADDKSLKVWSLLTQRCMYTEYGHTSRALSLDVGEGRMVLTGGQDSTCRYWNVDSQKHSILSDAKAESFESVRLLNRYGFVSGDKNGRLTLWSLGRRKPLKHVDVAAPSTGGVSWVSALTGIRDTDCVFSGCNSGVVEVWKASLAGEGVLEKVNEINMPGVVNGMSITADQNSLVCATAKEGRLGQWVTSKDREVGLAIVRITS